MVMTKVPALLEERFTEAEQDVPVVAHVAMLKETEGVPAGLLVTV
jgi:hypothetical protein